MKYEEIKVGDIYEVGFKTKKVIAKSDEHKAFMTISTDGIICGWDKEELEFFQPIKKELPESGLLVSEYGSLVFRTGQKSGYGFDSGNASFINSTWSFITSPKHWRTATPEDEAKFIKMLEAEAEKRGLGIDTKIKRHADGSSLHDPDCTGVTPRFELDMAYNKNGQIFHDGIWAEPLTMLDEVCDTIKKHLPNIVVEMTDGVVTLKQL